MSDRIPASQRKKCERGCGRELKYESKGGMCQHCRGGYPPPEPNPELCSDVYLIRCAQELQRRRDRLEAALHPLAERPHVRIVSGGES